jgi:hypothetical protein
LIPRFSIEVSPSINQLVLFPNLLPARHATQFEDIHSAFLACGVSNHGRSPRSFLVNNGLRMPAFRTLVERLVVLMEIPPDDVRLQLVANGGRPFERN